MTTETEDIAARAGLTHRPSDRPGIRRRRRGSGYSYVRPNGAPVSARERDRIAAMVIPPAWEDVWISPEADSHLIATGVDEAGRRQYLYHPEWRWEADRVKFARLAGFGRGLERIRRRVEQDLSSSGVEQLCALAVRLIDRALIRPGSHRESPTQAVGAATLGSDDVQLRGGRIVLDFVGKSGVDHHIEFRDPDLAKAIARRLDEAADDEPLFSGPDDGSVDAARLNRYLADTTGGPWTAKDLRTFGGTVVVVESLAAAMNSRAAAESKPDDLVRDAIAAAADALGNTVAVCRSSYVAPVVIDAFGDGRLARCWGRTRRGLWLSRAERATDRLLGEP